MARRCRTNCCHSLRWEVTLTPAVTRSLELTVILEVNRMNTKDLRLFSPTTYALERIFFWAQYLSPANLLLGTRVSSQRQFTSLESRRIQTIWRGRRIEAYVLCWLRTELSVAIVIPKLRGAWMLLLVLPGFRVLEIFQAAVNLNVFDRLRIVTGVHYIASIARTLLLSLWNFFELMLCFGIIYSSSIAQFRACVSPPDAYYFSVVTQLTIGYGDIQPLGLTRAFAATQGLLGFVFGLFVLSRLISFLPRTEPVLGDDYQR